MKTVRPKATGVRIPLPAPKMKHQSFAIGALIFAWNERILTPLCDSLSRRMGFAYPTRRSKSSLFRRRVRVSSPLVNTPLQGLLLAGRPIFIATVRGSRIRSPSELARRGVRIPHPKIEELALQAQGEGIFTFSEYPSSKTTSKNKGHHLRMSFILPLLSYT